MKKKASGTRKAKESSRVFFQNLRPKFLDWEPPTEEEKASEVRARKEAREAELKRVTDLAKETEMHRKKRQEAAAGAK